MEIWKDIKDYEGIYQVSNLGRLKSLEKTILKNGKHPFIQKEKILKQYLRFDGYRTIFLTKNSKGKTFQVHQLVAINFLNHTPNGSTIVVNHKDFNRGNNFVDNLEIVSMRENGNKKHIKSTSKYTGVNWDKRANKWRSQILVNKKFKFLGYFINEHDAHIAYENKLKEITKK